MIKRKHNLIIFSFLIAFLLVIPLYSSASLKIENGSVFSVNKTYEEDKQINFTLHNPNNFPMYNITFEENDYISMDKIDNLGEGDKVNVTANIDSNEELSSEKINIEGVYESEIGESNETHIIEIVGLEKGLSPCEKSVYKGDTIKWVNNVNDDVILKNTDNEEIGTVDSNSSFSKQMEQITEFSYRARIPVYGNLGENQVCDIKVMDTEGYIHNPEYDTSLTLTINMNYKKTNISVKRFEESYDLSYDSVQEGVLYIKNEGDKLAKDIRLSGDWFSFSPNNFDIEPGEGKNVQYTINPDINNTNQTDKDYNKTVTIEGNFPTIKKDYGIFIEHASIISEPGESDKNMNEILLEYFSLIKSYCDEEENQEKQICREYKKQVVYEGGNDSGYFNVTYEREQVRENQKATYELFKEIEEMKKWEKNTFDNISQRISGISNNSENEKEEVKRVAQEFSDTNDTWTYLAGILIAIVIGLIFFGIYDKLKDKRMFRKIDTY